MENILYYPYINIPRTDWSLRTLLYYNQIGSIVPQNYFYEPERYDQFMREMVQNELVIPINPIEILEKPWEISKPFIDYVESKEFKLRERRNSFRKGKTDRINENKFKLNGPKIHANKFDSEIFYQLEQAGLAKRENNEWYIVEQRTANDLMSFLASIVGGKLNFLPTTDMQVRKAPFTNSSNKVYKTKRKDNVRREIILKELIPFPEQIDLLQLRRFKDKYPDLLNRFKNKVELIALDHNLDEESQLFKETIKELDYQKEELSAKMNESRFGQLMFGTVCGITGAVIGLASAGTTGALVGSLSALPSFDNAIHSALKIEGVENITDQSGMKYLALVDKKIRRPGANKKYSAFGR
ncbi:MAG: kinase [Bacteroidetes bacterium]|nr:MAG: kinase [Bacteroidota bacterium]